MRNAARNSRLSDSAGWRRFRLSPQSSSAALGAVVVALTAAVAWGQQPQIPNPTQLVLDAKGVIQSVSPHSISMNASEKGDWVITIGPETQITVAGSAEPEYLGPGMTVKFSGELGKKFNLTKELDAVEIFDPPAKGGMGAFDSGSEDAKIVRVPAEGTTYEFRGRVASFKEGELIVSIGGNKKIIAKTAQSLNVTVNLHDPTIAQEGDSINASGWYSDQQRPNLTNMTPGEAVGNIVSITLAKPLASTKKVRPVAKKLGGRAAKAAAPAESTEPPNPFAK